MRNELRLRQILEQQPDNVAVYLQLGALLRQREAFVEAEQLYARGLQVAADDIPLRLEYGESLLDLNQPVAAIEQFRQVLQRQPDDADALASLGGALLRVAEPAEAAIVLTRAAQKLPEDGVVWELLGEAHAGCDRAAEALPAYLRAWQLGRHRRDIAFYCANVLCDAGHFHQASQLFRAGLQLDGESPPAWHNLGKSLFELGDVSAAANAFQRGSDQDVDQSLRNLSLLIPGDPAADHARIRQVRSEYARHIALDLPDWTASGGDEVNETRLRVGYVSSFFAKPNYMKPVYGVLAAHDPACVDVELFHDGPNSEDLNACIADSAVSIVHCVASLSNAELVTCIRERNLDVIVDLNAYSAMDRLPIYTVPLARRGVGWFNHYATAALPAIDILVGDAQTILPSERQHYGERVVQLPLSYLAFRVDHPCPDIVPPPCLRNGHLTFGCLCTQYKITPHVLAGWARIMAAVPTSRLLLANRTLEAPDVADYVRHVLTELGIAEQRITLRGGASHWNYLTNYNEIDVALDAWPYNGGTTTTEAMWQGVPVLCFAGDRWASRTSASLVVHSPFAEFLCASEPEMVEFGRQLGQSSDTPEMLSALRSTARARLLDSPVCDVPRLARELEHVYRAVT